MHMKLTCINKNGKLTIKTIIAIYWFGIVVQFGAELKTLIQIRLHLAQADLVDCTVCLFKYESLPREMTL